MKTKVSSVQLLCIAVSLFLANGPAIAAPVYFSTTDSYYEFVPAVISWDNARTAAESLSYLGRQGRLATITSQAENDFVVNTLLYVGAGGDWCWIGGYQPHGSTVSAPDQGWEWITGEPWAFTNWRPGEPNDSFTGEHCLELYGANQSGTWNDLPGDLNWINGYVVEYAVPEPSTLSLLAVVACVLAIGKRVSPKRTVLVCLALLTGMTVGQAQILSGPVHNPANDHDYFLTVQSTWSAAEATAISMGGHLTAINNQAENDWVFSTFSSFAGQPRNLWIGLRLWASSWQNGEPFTFSNYAPGEPNFADPCIYIIAPGISASGKWNDSPDVDSMNYIGYGESLPFLPIHGVIEVVPEPSALVLAVVGLGILGLSRRRSFL